MVTRSSRHQSPTHSSGLRTFALGAASLAILVLAVLFAINYWPLLHRQSQSSNRSPITANGNTKGEQPNKTTPSTTTSPQSNDGKQTSSNPGVLLDPTGNFVSTHHLSVTDYVTSTCTTTPGATCQISFTKDGVTKSLPALTTDAGGSVYWQQWRPADYGITAGSWTIQATATLNGDTKSATDALPFEVSS